MNDLKNKIILVTGGGKGIGESCVRKLNYYGAYLVVIIKDKKDNKKFKNLHNIKIYNGDVNNLDLIKKIFLDSKKEKRFINCLVNNAGVRFRKKFLEIKKKELKKVFDTNYFSIFNLMQEFAKYNIKYKIKGSIINVGSIVGENGFDELSGYASSKGALSSLTKSFAAEMSKYGIRANTIIPGFIKTSYFNKFKKNKKTLYNWTLSRIPMKRWGEPDEVANLIAFILSDKSKYINGANISIDGGWLNA